MAGNQGTDVVLAQWYGKRAHLKRLPQLDGVVSNAYQLDAG
jgi:hypothetical protein